MLPPEPELEPVEEVVAAAATGDGDRGEERDERGEEADACPCFAGSLASFLHRGVPFFLDRNKFVD